MDWQSDGRLPSELWIKAHLRRCFAEGLPATVIHRGEKNSGTLILKINQLDAGCRVLNQTRDLEDDQRPEPRPMACFHRPNFAMRR